jgi:hypothetical protein
VCKTQISKSTLKRQRPNNVPFYNIFPLFSDVASGGASDWALGVAGVPYSYSIELRDTGRYTVEYNRLQ